MVSDSVVIWHEFAFKFISKNLPYQIQSGKAINVKAGR